jgi:hypothetical protein
LCEKLFVNLKNRITDQCQENAWDKEKSRSHVEQKTYMSPFFDFPKQGNILGISDRTFFGGCGPCILLLSSFAECASLTKKTHCHEVNDLEIPSLLIALFKALFVPSIFLTLISNSIFQIHKQFFTQRSHTSLFGKVKKG